MKQLLDLINTEEEGALRLFTEVVLEKMADMHVGETFDVRDVVVSFIAGQPGGSVPLELADRLHAIADTVYSLAERSISGPR